jgi:hypothetical protein
MGVMGFTTGWYVYGELVIDHLLGVARSEVASVAFTSQPIPTPSVVRSRLGLAPYLSVEITNKPPRAICTLDEIVLLESGELYDVGRCDAYVVRHLELKLTTYEVGAEDILRLNRLLKGYPEIAVPTELVNFVTAGVGHLESLRSRFPEVGSLFARHATTTRWRAAQDR